VQERLLDDLLLNDGIIYARAENPFFRCRSVPEPRCIDLSDLLADRCPGAADHVWCVLKLIETGSIGRIVSGQCRTAECIRRAEDKLGDRCFGASRLGPLCRNLEP
jgi:hypothetical protein